MLIAVFCCSDRPTARARPQAAWLDKSHKRADRAGRGDAGERASEHPRPAQCALHPEPALECAPVRVMPADRSRVAAWRRLAAAASSAPAPWRTPKTFEPLADASCGAAYAQPRAQWLCWRGGARAVVPTEPRFAGPPPLAPPPPPPPSPPSSPPTPLSPTRMSSWRSRSPRRDKKKRRRRS